MPLPPGVPLDVAVACPDAPADAAASPAAAAMWPEVAPAVAPREVMPPGRVNAVVSAVLLAQNRSTLDPLAATFTDGAVTLFDTAPTTAEAMTVGTAAPE